MTALNTQTNDRLRMWGGVWGGLIPMLVLITVLFSLSIGGKGGVRAFWTAGWLALVLGLVLARNKSHYCSAIMRGLGDKNGIVIVTAWLFAGVFGKLMVAGGVVQGLLWMGLETGATGRLFVLVAFVAAMLFSMGTGTSTGTVLSLVPALYPAGVMLGAHPVALAVGILSGAAFGDNLAPISDTTIVSAFTQEADIRQVVKSRFPLAISAAVVTAFILLLFGSAETAGSASDVGAMVDPAGLLMLLSFAIVIISTLLGRHLVESLIYGNLAATFLGLCTKKIEIASLFRIPGTRGESTGLIQDGIESVSGAVLFALLMLAVTRILIETGVLDRILNALQRTLATSVIRAELSIVAITILASIPVASNAAAELLVGPGLVKPLGERFGLQPARRANLMDCSVCTIFYTMPWAIAVVVWAGAVASAAEAFSIPGLPFGASFLNPYSYALLLVLLVSIFTGWNRGSVTANNTI